MNLKSCHSTLLATVFFALLAPLSAFGQEDKANFDSEIAAKDPNRESVKHEQETPSGTEPTDPRSSKNMPAVTQQEPVSLRDTEIKSAKPVSKVLEKAHKEEEKAQKQEEDPLSFNFLYYIIEKFKLSDIVE